MSAKNHPKANDSKSSEPKKAGGRVVRNDSKNNRGKQPRGNGSWNKATQKQQLEELEECEQCVICADKIVFGAVSPCNHTTCHTCTFRQRALYDKKICLVCRTENERVTITESWIDKKYSDFSQADYRAIDDEHGIDFTSAEAHAATLDLLKLLCPMKHCKMCQDKVEFKTFKQLNEHVKSEHDRHFCEICALHKKAFVSELQLFHLRELQQHKSKGDSDGFKGHPACQFCTGKRFYSDDEKFVHLREKHEKCHVCDQIDATKPQYFRNYEQLSEHFRDRHYVCNVQSCLDQKFVVFMDEFDLKAHMLKEHKNLFGGNKNLLTFGNIGYSTPRHNGFGSQLSTFTLPNNNNNNNNNSFQDDHNNRNNNRLPKGFKQDDEDEVDSQELKKMRLEERARHYLNYNAASLTKFKDINKKYEDYKIEAPALVKGYREIFTGLSPEDLGILLYEFSELFEANSLRRKRLVEASQAANGNVGKSNNSVDEKFPALPGSSAYNFTGSSWNAPKLTKSLKGRTNAELFPALPLAGSAPKLNTKVISYKTTLTPKSSVKPVINRTSHTSIHEIKQSYLSGAKQPARSSAKSSSTASVNDAAFPLLPKVVVKKPPRVNPIRTDSGVWGRSSALTSASSSNNSSTFDLTSLDNSLSEASNGKKKKKKQMLFHVGI